MFPDALHCPLSQAHVHQGAPALLRLRVLTQQDLLLQRAQPLAPRNVSQRLAKGSEFCGKSLKKKLGGKLKIQFWWNQGETILLRKKALAWSWHVECHRKHIQGILYTLVHTHQKTEFSPRKMDDLWWVNVITKRADFYSWMGSTSREIMMEISPP